MRFFRRACLVAALTLPVVAQGQTPRTRAALPPLHHESVAYDTERSRLVVYAGSDSLRGTWEWDGSVWVLRADSASSPTMRFAATMGYDPIHRRMMLFGGWRGSPFSGGEFRAFCDTWILEGDRWTQVNDGPCFTDRVRDNSIIHHPQLRAMLLADGTPEIAPDTMRPLRLWRWDANSWRLIDSTGPRRSEWDQIAYDAARDRLVMPIFRGPDAGVWEWDSREWRRIVAEGPPARQVFSLAYDERSGRVVLFGGQTFDRPPRFLNDAWSWDGSQWHAIATPDDGPVGRSGAFMHVDARMDRALFFGGYRGPPFQALPELWMLDASGWREWRAR